MKVSELKEKIKNNSFSHKLIFVGEEEYIQKTFIELLKNKLNCNAHYYYDYENIKDFIFEDDLFNEGEIYIIRNSKYFLKNYKKFNEIEVPDNKVLILIYDDYEAKKPLFSENSKILCDFIKMPKNTLKIIINQYLNLNDDNCNLFCDLVDNNTLRLLQEIDKLNILKNESNFKNDDELFNYALKDNLIYKENLDTLNLLADNILKGNYKEAFKINKTLDKEQDDIFKLISKIYDKISVCNKNIEKSKSLLYFLQELEENIKSGKVENLFAFDYLIITLKG